MLDALPVGIFRCNTVGQVTYVNQKICQIMQMDTDELLGDGWVRRFHPNDREQVFIDWQSSIEQKIPFCRESQLLMPDGSSVWTDARTVIEQDAAGNFVGYLGIVIDVSDRKRVEIALQSLVEGTASAIGKEFFPVLVKQITQALGVRHAAISQLINGRLQSLAFWSDDRLLPNTSYSLEDSPCGRTLQEGAYYCPKALQQIFPNYLDLIPLQAESYLGVVMQDAGGNPFGILSILDSKPIQNRKRFEDILKIFAARAAAELERQQATTALQQLNAELESRVKKRTIELTHVNAQLVDKIAEHRRTEAELGLQLERLNRLYHLVLTLNNAETVEEIYALALEGIQQTFKSSGASALVPDEQGILRYCAASGLSETYQQAVELYLQSKNESSAGVVISDVKMQPGDVALDALREAEGIAATASFPLHYQGQPLGKIIVYYDTPHQFAEEEIQLAETIAAYVATAVTRKQSEKALQQTNERLELTNAELARATRLKDEFLANMSHELRTPLNAILGLSEGLIDEAFGTLNDFQRKSVFTIERSGKHLLELINDILDLAKIEAGKIELQLDVVPVKQLCDSSLAFVRQLALKKQIQLKTEIASEVDTIVADERRLRQALINLLSNAVKFTNEGGSVTLEVTPDRSQQQIRFNVIDTGIGIAQEDIYQLFQSFVQLDRRLDRQYAGTGLGLVLARRIAELHNGTITVESEVEKGSQFAITLPWKSSSIAAKSQRVGLLSTPASSGTDPENWETVPLILLAEDNDINTEMLFDYLTCRGYQVTTAKNGFSAIEKAVILQPDLILMDIQMPKMDGLAAIRRIRTDLSLVDIAQTPIIALTALAMPSDRQRCLDAGANAYLAKPIELKSLTTLIQQLLQEKQNALRSHSG